MASHHVNVMARGLVTAPNPLAIPADALSVADNIIFDRPGLIASRRGFQKYGSGPGGPVWKLFFHQGLLFAHYGNSSAPSALKVYVSGAWQSFTGTFNASQSQRLRAVSAEQSLYFTTTDTGVYRVDTYTSLAALAAGLPKALGIDRAGPAAVLTGATGFLAENYGVAYRAVIGYKDNNGRLFFGAPSSRTVVSNTTGTSGYVAGQTKNVVARVLLPKANNTASTALTTSYFLQLYRSAQVGDGAIPSDELQLVYESYLTAGQITAGYVDITDITPDAQRGAYLYTNPNTGDDGVRVGIVNANEPPPIAKDIAFWRDVMWYANTTGRYRLAIQILGVGSTGLAVGHTLTIGGVTYTAIAPGAPAANQFVVETTGAVAATIEATANNLVAAINKSASNTTLWAYYVSGPSPDAPGKIIIETRTLNGASFTAVASANGTAYLPNLTTAQTSSRDAQTAALYFSKPSMPDAVPLVNELQAGPQGASISRIWPLRDQLFVFTSVGLCRVTGTSFRDFSVDAFDTSCILAAPEAVCTVDNRVFALTTQGVASITEAGVEYVSADIDYDLRNAVFTGAGLSVVATFAFMVGHQQDHRAILWLPTSASDTAAKIAYCYDLRSKAWTRWYIGTTASTADVRSCGVYNPDDLTMYLGDLSTDGKPFAERRAFNTNDYSDGRTDASDTAIYRVATWAQQDAGDASQAKHWMVAQFLLGDTLPPTTYSVSFSSESGNESISVTQPDATILMRSLPIGRSAGRGARLTVSASSSTTREGFDIAGLSLWYRPYGWRLMR